MSFMAFCPPGVILPYAGATAPEGWLLCNGAAVSQAVYKPLFDAVGLTWGNPGGGSFNLPDLRGAFIRGAGTDGGVHVGPALGAVQTHATAKNGLSLGGTVTFATSVQGALDHQHGSTGLNGLLSFPGGGAAYVKWKSYSWTANNAIAANNPGSSSAAQTSAITVEGSVDAGGAHGHTANTASVSLAAGDTETRPNSKGVNYIIKV